MTQPLKLFSAAFVEQVVGDIETNLDKYHSGDFSEIAREIGWVIETTSARWDPAIASQLDPANTPEAEFKNSLLVYKGLEGMTPALARDERIWTRLCHVECLDYARNRWVRGSKDAVKQVRRHFFCTWLSWVS